MGFFELVAQQKGWLIMLLFFLGLFVGVLVGILSMSLVIVSKKASGPADTFARANPKAI